MIERVGRTVNAATSTPKCGRQTYELRNPCLLNFPYFYKIEAIIVDSKERDMLATMTSKGQLTVPKEIRDKLGLDAGAKLDFAMQEDGSIRVRALSGDPLALVRVLPPPGRERVTEPEIRAVVRDRAAARFKRSAK